MEKITLHKRDKRGINKARKERKLGKVPGIIYGKNIDNLMFEIGELELNKEIYHNGEHSVLQVEFEGESYKTVIKEIQRDPVNHRIVHIDLGEIPENEQIHTDVSIIFKGENSIIKKGGIIQKEKSNVKVQCKGKDIPKYINVDLSSLKIGESYRVCDIELSEDIVCVDDLNTIIALVSPNNKSIQSELETVKEA